MIRYIVILVALNLRLSLSVNLTTEQAMGTTNRTCNCDWRYLKHYETKNCKPVYDELNECNCPVRFQCAKLNVDSKVCHLNGRAYAMHEKVQTSNPCEVCYCRQDFTNGKSSIQCAPLDCFQLSEPLSDNCYLYYEKGQCCPVEKCDTNKKSSQKGKVCIYNGKEFKIGQKIYSEDDPCLTCRCSENWTGINNDSCSLFNCDLEKDIHKLTKGCIPIYHDKTCCPIDYHCPVATIEDENEEQGFEGPDLCQEEPLFGSCHEAFTRYYYNSKKASCEEFLYSGCKGSRNNFASPAECEVVCESGRPNLDHSKENMCYFDGLYYPKGDIIDIKHATNCVTCTCQTPPDFTCVHRSCPGPPSNDNQSCQTIYKENSCCADFNCTTKFGKPNVPQNSKDTRTNDDANKCQPIDCPAPRCKKIIVSDNCPKCECGIADCVTPRCDAGCFAEVNVPDGRCPDCICPPTDTNLKPAVDTNNCPPINCPPPLCTKIIQRNECPKCECVELVCVPPRCQRGCTIETNVPEGRCPACDCPPTPIDESVQNELNANHACPSINCEDPSCRQILKSGQCPICDCEQLVCSRPKCEPGCQVEEGVTDRCPGCQCLNETSKKLQHRRTRDTSCLTPICHPGCHIVRKNDGCLTCKCEQCIPPKCICPTTVCEEGCHLDRNVSYGQCPVCVCTRNGLNRDRCQIPPCNAANCKLVSEDDGCLKCKCDDLCLPPRCFCSKPTCADGCEIDTDVRDGRCPGCKCKPSSFIAPASRPETPKALCPPTRRCDTPNCQLKLNREGCAYCECKQVTRSCPAETCPSSCKLEMHPSNGDCPVCICKFDKEEDEREYESIPRRNTASSSDRRTSHNCPVTNCPDCSKTTDSQGCEQCDCRPVHRPVSSRPVIRRTTTTSKPTSTTTDSSCPQEVCQRPFCRSVLGDDGCPTCQCKDQKEQCSMPDCPSHCALKKQPGECPVCACPNGSPHLDRSNEQTARQPTRSCANESCHGIKCRLIPGDNGCQTCICEEPCRPITCDRRCTRIDNPANGKCPYCLCNF